MAEKDWGQAHVNNIIGFGQGYINSTNGWGESYRRSYAGKTSLTGFYNDAMVVEYTLDSDGYDVEIEVIDEGTISFYINWGDGNVEEITSAQPYSSPLSHTYTSAGTYNVQILGSWGDLTWGKRAGTWSSPSRSKITDIKQWGTNTPTNSEWLFADCDGLTAITAIDTPNPPTSGDCRSMFVFSNNFVGNGSLSEWNTTGVTRMGGMFKQCNLTADISKWDFSSISTGSTGLGTFLNGGSLTTANYDLLLKALATDQYYTTPSGLTLDMGSSTYTTADSAGYRATLTTGKSWTITDGGGI